MSDFAIEFEWLGGAHLDLPERATAAELRIRVDDQMATHLEDLEARTVRNGFRGCASTLAVWLVANWWRLRWEPEPAVPDLDWRMAHQLPATGGGFVWPDLTLASDGSFIHVRVRPSQHAAHEPIRYLNTIDEVLPAAHFERAVDEFVEAVLARRHAFGVQRAGLEEQWALLSAERGNPELCWRRTLEAMAGYDAEAMPERLEHACVAARDRLGRSATLEVASSGRHDVLADFEAVEQLQHGGEPADFASVDDLESVVPVPGGNVLPWQAASDAARMARRCWRLGETRLSDVRLAELAGTPTAVLTQGGHGALRHLAAAALRDRTTGARHRLILDKPRVTSRRFALARLLGDQLIAPDDDHLLPAGASYTARQKFQRAFAAELLCPFEQIRARYGDGGGDGDEVIDEIAAEYAVSPLMVRTQLVNRGVLARSALGA